MKIVRIRDQVQEKAKKESLLVILKRISNLRCQENQKKGPVNLIFRNKRVEINLRRIKLTI